MTYFEGLEFLPSLPQNGAMREVQGEYSLHFCRAGRVWWNMNGGEARLLNAPLAWWTLPEHLYSFGFDDAAGGHEWEHFEVRFAGPRTEAMRAGGLIRDTPQEPHLRVLNEIESFERTFAALYAQLEPCVEGETPSPLAHARAVHYLEDLFLALQEEGSAGAILSPIEEAVNQWIEQVRRAPYRNWNIADDAAKLAISEGHFRRLVGKLAGVSPHRFVLDRRLDAGAARLRTTKEPIKAVALACGFEDVNHFTRLFTTRFHLPPATYRRANRMMEQETARLRRRQRFSSTSEREI